MEHVVELPHSGRSAKSRNPERDRQISTAIPPLSDQTGTSPGKSTFVIAAKKLKTKIVILSP